MTAPIVKLILILWKQCKLEKAGINIEYYSDYRKRKAQYKNFNCADYYKKNQKKVKK